MPADEVVEADRHADNQRRIKALEDELAAAVETINRLDARAEETLDVLGAIKSLIGQLDVPALREMADAMNTMKGGVRVLGWLERPAKWLTVMAALAASIYGLWKIK
ncbi:hypothetical protein ASF61_16735 [Duganella sp. Leaf126]|uniref:hypothetical protein n=1 Tax=Duganella sp. Leaf126 TaxID=1736266 RepID=UPI0006FF9AF4|nr:hypothetical protein [Duganella sp. Leaf126]KQQ31981.1 hypothetical protein ASF61_16735 [Duganella sp. Leaf126]